MMPAPELRQLRERPFELLAEMERRARVRASGHGAELGADSEWVGIAFRLGEDLLVTPREHVREVLMYPPATRVPGAKAWVNGLANVRGQLLPLIDLAAYRGSAAILPGRATRVLVVSHRRVPAGLVVHEVMGFRHFLEAEHEAGTVELSGLEDYTSGVFARGDDRWPVLNLRRLVEHERFLNAAQ